MKILVAEDDPVTRKILAATLERLGWDVVSAEDGNAAWQVFKTLRGKGAPELAVLDWMMPGLEGIEICRRLRVRVGERTVNLQRSLAARVTELEEALGEVRALQGLLPICSYCKKVRNEANYWEQVDSYLTSHSDLELTHGICPVCLEKMMKELDASPA